MLIDAPDPEVILAGTGSEVQLCVDAAASLASAGIASRVVSMPCWELFLEQDEGYRSEVFPAELPVVGVEAGVSLGWERWANMTVTLDHFGASAPGGKVMEEFGFTAASVEAAARSLLQ